MGKSLKGKECGKGIHQRKDGSYSARFVDRAGKRHEKYFHSLTEARIWLKEAKLADEQEDKLFTSETTVDEWFNFWIENIVGDLAPNTLRHYRDRYFQNIKPVIGDMPIASVKPMHCNMVLLQMYDDYAGSTISETYSVMGTLFKSAKMNDLIFKHPMDGIKPSKKPVRAKDKFCFLTRKEHKLFLQNAKDSRNFEQYVLILETGLRTGELMGLTWDAIDFEKHTLTVNKSLEYRYSTKEWRARPPKTPQSYRTIPLTDVAYEILKNAWEKRNERKISSDSLPILNYLDLRTGVTSKLDMRELVFINQRRGVPTKNSAYDNDLYKICDNAGIHRVSMHALRHTYATRAIESGMQHKILQVLMGHGTVTTTMDRYVHVANESLEKAIKQFEKYTFCNNN